ncbi:uncharacterized protein BXZ73DRAFT_54798 [Epithele typhae]|uniref:uncharacterized protein n=1 Tax=Epithele typhae TaxID=378194 RepID=UPI0020074CA2|nr:uncharacterized protein BXZ73DRAFT_54798 [Epithele typhae]KAH9914640.1 hypothetical protein BXZ73DRAFT_54798 [Epithele typhae]
MGALSARVLGISPGHLACIHPATLFLPRLLRPSTSLLPSVRLHQRCEPVSASRTRCSLTLELPRDPSVLVAAGPSNIPRPAITLSSVSPAQSGDPSKYKSVRYPRKNNRPKRKRIASGTNANDDTKTGANGDAATDAVTASVREEDDDDDGDEVYSVPWLDGLQNPYESVEQRLHDELAAFFKYMTPTPDERHARAVVIAQVSDVVRGRFPMGTVDTFGSVAQDLYLPDADTDLVITTPLGNDEDGRKRALFQLAALMRRTQITDTFVQVIHRARVPVISFQTAPDLGSLKIDISLNATDGIKAVPVLRAHLDAHPALRFLILTLKALLSRHSLNSASSSGLSSYGLFCLAIHFLRLNPGKRPPEAFAKPLESRALGGLFLDFLRYYAEEFEYETSVVSVREGKLLTKEGKGWLSKRDPHMLAIECMLNPDNDIGRPTSKIRRIRALFARSYKRLSTYALSPDGTAPPNILGTILGVSASVHPATRALLKDVVSSGRLSRKLKDVQLSQQQIAVQRSMHNGAGLPPPPPRMQQYDDRRGEPPRYDRRDPPYDGESLRVASAGNRIVESLTGGSPTAQGPHKTVENRTVDETSRGGKRRGHPAARRYPLP